MEEQVLKLIFDYSNNHRMIDREYIDKFISIIVNSMELNDYVRNTNFLRKGEKEKTAKGKLSIQLANASDFADLDYNSINHDITVYIDKIPKIYEQISKINLDSNEMMYLKTILYTQRLLHELIHADQEKRRKQKDNLESKILDCCLPKSSTSNHASKDEIIKELAQFIFRIAVYIKNYKYAPHDRMAEIDSCKILLSILSSSSIELPNTKQFLKDNLLRNLIEAYEDTFSPTIQFISEMDEVYEKNTLTEFNWYDEDEKICLKKSIELYSFEQRIRCGLPIEEEKKEKLLKKLHSSKYGYTSKK